MQAASWPAGKKLVHLDLKGAPPRIPYLHRLLELFAQLGADGVLDVARSNGLEVIPLIQTFGHMEFVLKHRSLSGLREMDRCLGTLSPHGEEGPRLVMEMLRQVVELHPGLRTLHIGADEVYMLGDGEESKQWLSTPGHTVEQLFLGHVTRVAGAVKEAWPHLNVVMWDDMLRGMSGNSLKASGLVGLVQPMLWDYNPGLNVEETVSLLEKYGGAGLTDLWAASAFKGSTSVHSSVTPTQRHVDNHLQWLKVVQALPPGLRLLGIALTGWQRYDHMSVLCELMPVALPSLVACLRTLVRGHFGPEVRAEAAQSLGLASVEVDALERTSEADSLFLGRRLAMLIVELAQLLDSEEVRNFESNMFVRGWFSPYHRQRRAVNPLICMQIQSQADTLLNAVEERAAEAREEMVRLFPDSTAQEWMEQHVSPVTGPLRRISEEIGACLSETGPPQ
ncbi:hypothetical protein NHX12_024581 [Muraenolepis orangiensis]|uniref:beta-N-acetylhexosaminidase n=1 Tax=Muraenolepis orangiensis TaxID=630683 RepID=A0A9Q0EHN1_9TELE|nr:hypothetical protein NHX12_024581 [Muraenolepis orangiensis]